MKLLALTWATILMSSLTAMAQEELAVGTMMSLDSQDEKKVYTQRDLDSDSPPPRYTAQDNSSPEPYGRAEPGETQTTSELFYRYSGIRGNDGTGAKYSTDFKNGNGFRFETDSEFYFTPHWSLGVYVSWGIDIYEAKSTTDPTVGTITANDWVVVPLTIGAEGKFTFGKHSQFFAEAYLGIGFVVYSNVTAEAAGVSVPVIDSSIAFAFEVGAHFGWKITPWFGLMMGVSYENWGAPTLDPSTFPGVSAGSIGNVTFDIGIWWRY